MPCHSIENIFDEAARLKRRLLACFLILLIHVFFHLPYTDGGSIHIVREDYFNARFLIHEKTVPIGV